MTIKELLKLRAPKMIFYSENRKLCQVSLKINMIGKIKLITSNLSSSELKEWSHFDQQEWINTVVRTFSAVTGDSASVVLRGKWGWWNHLRCLLHVQPHLLSPAALSCDLLLSAHRQLQFTVRTLYHIRLPLIIATYDNNEKTKQVLEHMFYKSVHTVLSLQNQYK